MFSRPSVSDSLFIFSDLASCPVRLYHLLKHVALEPVPKSSLFLTKRSRRYRGLLLLLDPFTSECSQRKAMAFLGFGKDPVLSLSQPVLEPQLKPGQKDAHTYKPGAFETPIGRLLVPRMKEPPQPTSDVIAMALSGRLTSFLKDGRIFRASKFVGQVSAQTAKISLDDMYEYQTRQLLPPTTESTKSLLTLFYLALKLDELPSYHFWTALEDTDPVTAGGPIDWDAEFRKSRPIQWGSIQQGKNEREDSQTDDGLFSEPVTQTSTKTQEAELAASKDRPGKPGDGKDPSPPISVAHAHNKNNTSDEKECTTDKPLNQPGGMAYARSLHIPGLRQDLPEVATTSPNEGTSASIHPLDQAGKSSAQIPCIGQGLSKPDTISGKGFQLAVAGGLSSEQHREPSILLRFEWGAMYLEDSSHTAFRQLARYLTQYEKDEIDTGFNPLFVDILKPGGPPSVEYRVPDSGSRGSRDFAREIKPYLGLPGHHYRIRSDAYTPRLPFDSGQSGTLKLTRVGFGYCYVDAVGSWNSKISSERMENSANFQNGLSFLFGRDKCGDPISVKEIPKLLTLEIFPQPGAIDITNYFVSRELGELFHNITSSQMMTSDPLEPVPWRYSAEVFVHETADTFVHPDALAAAARELCDDQARETQEARLLDQQLVQEYNETVITSQQTSQAEWSTTSPRAVFEIVGGPNVPSVRPRVRTQSEIEELERQLESAEARLSDNTQAVELDRMYVERGLLRSQIQGLEGQISFLTRENDRLNTKVHNLDDRVDELEQEGGQSKSQVEQLEGQAKGLHHERRQLESRIKDLQEEAIQSAENSELLGSTANKLEDQVLRSTRECYLLQSRVSDVERQMIETTEERDELRIQAVKLKRHASAVSDPNHIATHTEDPQPRPQTAVNAEAQSQSKGTGLKELIYCIVCLASVDKMSPSVRSTTPSNTDG